MPVVQPGRRQNGGARSAPAAHLKQPCVAFDGCCCRIYAERPAYCRQFECLLLKSVKAGARDTAGALRLIRETRERTETVRRLLRALGDTDERLSLSQRFRRTARRLEQVGAYWCLAQAAYSWRT